MRLAPREATVGGDRLQHFERCFVRTAGAFVVEAEIAAILEPHDAAEGHDAGEAERWHFLPCFALVLAHDARHAGTFARALGGGKDPQALLARRIGHAVDAGAVLMRLEAGRHEFIHARPCDAAVVAARHRPGSTAVVDAPHAEDRLAIRHQNSRRMTLISLLRACGDDRVAVLLIRDVHDGQIGFVFGRNEGGGEEGEGKKTHGQRKRYQASRFAGYRTTRVDQARQYAHRLGGRDG